MPAVQPRITVSMNQATFNHIKQLAEKTGVSMSAYCNIMISRQIILEEEEERSKQRIAELDSDKL